MATPEIQSGQLNKADLEKLKKVNTSMPKTETTSSNKLASSLSGNKTNNFGKLSKTSGSLASSLSTKSSGKTSSKESIFGTGSKAEKTEETPAPTTETNVAPASEVSIYEQNTINSRVNTIQNDIITAKNSSIFSVARSGSTTSESSDLDFSASANAQTCIGEAKRLASLAASAASSENWIEARNKYEEARKKLQEAQAEINKAKRNGEDLTKYETEINDLDTKYKTAAQNSVSSSNSNCPDTPDVLTQQYAQTLNQYNAWLNQEKSSLYAGLSGCSGTVATSSPGFAGLFGSALAQALPNMFGQALSNGGKSDGAKGSGKSSGSEKPQGSKRTGGSDDDELDIDGVEDSSEAQKAKADFDKAGSNINALDVQIVGQEKITEDINAQIEKMHEDLKKEASGIQDLVKTYENTKKEAEENKQNIAKEESTINENQAIVDVLVPQVNELSQRAKSEEDEAIAAEKISNGYIGQGASIESPAAGSQLGIAKQEVTKAQNEYNSIKDNPKMPEATKTAKLKELVAAQEKYADIEKKAIAAKKDADEKRAKATKTKEELKNVKIKLYGKEDGNAQNATPDSAIGKLQAAKENKQKLVDKQKDLDGRVKTAKEGLDNRKEETEKYKDSIDKLYSQQTESVSRQQDLAAQKNIDEMTQKVSRKTVEDIKDKYDLIKDRKTNKDRSYLNPMTYISGTSNMVRDWVNADDIDVDALKKKK